LRIKFQGKGGDIPVAPSRNNRGGHQPGTVKGDRRRMAVMLTKPPCRKTFLGSEIERAIYRKVVKACREKKINDIRPKEP